MKQRIRLICQTTKTIILISFEKIRTQKSCIRNGARKFYLNEQLSVNPKLGRYVLSRKRVNVSSIRQILMIMLFS